MPMNSYTLALLFASPVLGQFSFSIGDFSTFPQVPQTASINGFADPIYGQLPQCAHECVKENTGNTPCPYWDTGCLCIMPQWIDPVADCFAQNCKGTEASSASQLASSLCHSVGAWWGIGASDSTSLVNAIADTTAAAAASATSSAAHATATQGSASPVASTNAQTAAAATGSPSSEASKPTSAAKSEAKGSSKASVAAASSSSGASAPALNRNGAALTGVAAMGAVVAVLAHAL